MPDLNDINKFLEGKAELLRDLIIRDTQTPPMAAAIISQLSRIGVEVQVDFGCSVLMRVTDTFIPPQELANTPDSAIAVMSESALDALFTENDWRLLGRKPR